MAGVDASWQVSEVPASWPSGVGVCFTRARLADGSGFDLGGVGAVDVLARNRALLAQRLGVARTQFLRQVHGTDVVNADSIPVGQVPAADAVYTSTRGIALAILTADCLPVLFADQGSRWVAAAHAGWRGLAAGVLERTVAALPVPPSQVHAWLGPAIGRDAFEIGPEVREALIRPPAVEVDAAALSACVVPGRGDRWHADLAALASIRLGALGLASMTCVNVDVAGADGAYFSFRRDAGSTGRQASVIWLDQPASSQFRTMAS